MSMANAMLDPKSTAEFVARLGVTKANLTLPRMWILSLLAGAYIGIGCFIYLRISTSPGTTPGTLAAPTGSQLFLGGVGFSTGLVMIVFAGAELFTGNCLLVVAVLERRISILEMLFDWFVVWWGNFFGGLILSSLVLGTGLFDNDTDPGRRLCAVVSKKANLDAHQIFFRGLCANVLVCLAVIAAYASKTPTGKIFGIVMPIATFVALGFEHSIANQTFFSIATMTKCHPGDHGWYWLNLLLSTVGNILGASILAVSYWTTYVRKDLMDVADAKVKIEVEQERIANESFTQMPPGIVIPHEPADDKDAEDKHNM